LAGAAAVALCLVPNELLGHVGPSRMLAYGLALVLAAAVLGLPLLMAAVVADWRSK